MHYLIRREKNELTDLYGSQAREKQWPLAPTEVTVWRSSIVIAGVRDPLVKYI